MVVEKILWLIDELEKWIDQEYLKLLKHFPKHPRCRRQAVQQVVFFIFNNQKFISMDPINLLLGKGNYPVIAGLIDSKTLLPKAEAVPTFVSNASDNSAAATINSDGSIAPVAAGTFNLTAKNSWSYTDSVTKLPVTGVVLTTVQPFAVVEVEGVLQTIAVGPAVPVAPAA